MIEACCARTPSQLSSFASFRLPRAALRLLSFEASAFICEAAASKPMDVNDCAMSEQFVLKESSIAISAPRPVET